MPNEYIIPQKNNTSKIEVEIGDTKQIDFYPQAKIKQWNNEVNFSVRYKSDIINSTHSLVDNKYNWQSADQKSEVSIYEIDGYEDGGLEFEVILHEKPDSNIIEYTLEHKELRFAKQRPLTQQEIDEGHIQPENVTNSYAVFHNSKMNNEYKTGKAFHIYRPYVIDNNKNKEWCDIDIQLNKMNIIIPQDFLDKAVYPIIIDPTFGYSSIGTNEVGPGANNAGANVASPDDNADLDSITVYTRSFSGSHNCKGCIWEKDAGAPYPLLTNGVTPAINITSTSPSWLTGTYSSKPSVVSTKDYYVGFVNDHEYCHEYYDFDNPLGCSALSVGYASPGDLPAPYNTERKYSVYATYSTGPADITGILPLFKPVRT